MAEFGIFVYLLKILSNIKESSVSVYLESSCRLLKEFLQWNVYSARNDDIAKSQQVVLNEIADEMVNYLADTKRKLLFFFVSVITSRILTQIYRL